MSVLDIRNLSIDIGPGKQKTPVLRQVNLNIASGQVCGLVGESGAGKSMVAKTILGLLPGSAEIKSGSIHFYDRDLLTMSSAQKRKLLSREIALIPQDPMISLNPVKRIGKQLGEGMQLHLGISKSAAERRALVLLEDVLIKEPKRVLESYAHELSGGMRQRILIAMAFSCEPQLIVADEPTTALDVTVQRKVLSLIQSLQQKSNTAMLFVSHDLGVVSKICDQVAVMFDGRIIEHCETGLLFQGNRHPYTQALLDATPRYDQPDKLINPVSKELLQQLVRETKEIDEQRIV